MKRGAARARGRAALFASRGAADPWDDDATPRHGRADATDGAESAPRGPRRRRSRPRRSLAARLRLLVVWLAAGAAGLAAGVRASEPIVARLRPQLLAVERVALVGAERVKDEEVVAALGLRSGTPVLAVDAGELRRRLEALPWVARARVALLRPGRVLVALEEREPVAVALLGSPPTRWWLDSEGVPFLPVGVADARGRAVVVGPEDAKPRAPDPRLAEGVAVARALAAHALPPVREVRVGRDAPSRLPALVLASGTRVTLGPGDLDRKLARLAALLAAGRPEVAAAFEIDLRFGDRMVLRSGPPPADGGGVAAAGGRPPAPYAEAAGKPGLPKTGG
ncbi:MAG TPA: FtsQ-type POTRA domain-containing protein [Myxococcota bacterium]|nr:FtsQ-type POTRA domain-containing protein [Myxococcota bacterium]